MNFGKPFAQICRYACDPQENGAFNIYGKFQDSIFLIRIPFWLPTPIPTVMAVGVASPMPQGQATTSTVTMFLRAM